MQKEADCLNLLGTAKSWKVSVVIPSYRRHEEVLRAVMSALGQRLPPVEVIVSNDGPDPDKRNILKNLEDERIKYVEAPRKGNAGATRNFGIKHATGDWIALLDDDDVWLPEKLEMQFLELEKRGANKAILAGVENVYFKDRLIMQRPKRVETPGNGSLFDYLFSGSGGIHTSAIVAPTSLFLKYPFNEHVQPHEDWEWLLNAGKDVPFIVTGNIVCRRWLQPGQGLSHSGGFTYSWDWYLRNRHLIPSTNRAFFISKILFSKAAVDRKYSAIPLLFRELKSIHAPANTVHLLQSLLFLPGLRRWLRQIISQIKR